MKMQWILIFAIVIGFFQLEAENFVWTFPPETLSSGTANASGLQIAMDPNGNAVAVWIENSIIYSRNKPLNGKWSDIETVSGAEASDPMLVIDATGNATAIWVQEGAIAVSTQPYGEKWPDSPIVLSGADAFSPVIAVDPAGNLAAAWSRNGYIEAALKPVSQSWTTPTVISTTGVDDTPDLAFNGSGGTSRAVLVWHSVNQGKHNIYLASNTSLNNTQWSVAQNISDPVYQNSCPKVAVDPQKNASVSWFKFDLVNGIYSKVDVQSILFPYEGPTGQIVDISLDGGIVNPTTLFLRLACDADGNVFAFWNNSSDGSTYFLKGAFYSKNKSWQPVYRVIDLNRYAYSGDLSFNPVGDVYVTFMCEEDESIKIKTTTSDVSGGFSNLWHAATTLSVGSINAFPCIASAEINNLIYGTAAWTFCDNLFTEIQSISGTQQVFFPPSGLSVIQQTNNYKAFIEYYNIFSWNPSSTPGVAGYLIIRNDQLIQRIDDPSITRIVDGNRNPNEADTYGIIAFDHDYNFSRIVTITYP